MKNYLFLLFLGLASCDESAHIVGTLENLNTLKNDSIQVYRYQYGVNRWEWVFVSKFVKQPRVETITYDVRHGKTTDRLGNVILYENDSIQVIRKSKNKK